MMYVVVIALTHDMGEFESTVDYTDEAATALVLKLRADGVNCYARPASTRRGLR